MPGSTADEEVAMLTAHRIRIFTAGVVGVLGAGSVGLITSLPARAASTVSIDGGTAYQTIDGFGVSEAFGQANSIRNLATTPRQRVRVLSCEAWGCPVWDGM
jgi:PII-like signaling protein